MPWTNEHLEWLCDTGEVITTSCGKSVPIYEFRHNVADAAIMQNWAKHFRNHYCLDSDLPLLKPEGMTKADFFLTLKFPDRSSNPGPSIRAGDFAEILVADYLEFRRAYYVPRTRYDRKIIGNESSKGSDVIGFKQQGNNPNNNDELVIYEVKARLSENKKENDLQNAIDHSSKDERRLAESLNGIKQRLYDKSEFGGVAIVNRFQKNVDAPYKIIFGAAAVLTETSCRTDILAESDSTNHVAVDNLEMLVIRGQNFNDFST